MPIKVDNPKQSPINKPCTIQNRRNKQTNTNYQRYQATPRAKRLHRSLLHVYHDILPLPDTEANLNVPSLVDTLAHF